MSFFKLAYMLIPERIPAFPRPVTARPQIKATEVCAEAHTIDPIKNSAITDAKTGLKLKSMYSFPRLRTEAVEVIRLGICQGV